METITSKDVKEYHRNILQSVVNAINVAMTDSHTSPRLASKLARFRAMVVREIEEAIVEYDNATPELLGETE